MQREMLERGVKRAMAAGASAAKIWIHRHDRMWCEFEAAKAKSAGSAVGQSISIEVLSGGRLGRAGGNALAHIDELVDRAVALSQVGSAAHFKAYPEPSAYTPVKASDEATAALGAKALYAPACGIVDRLKRADPEMFISASARRTIAEGEMVSSSGMSYGYRTTQWSMEGGFQRTVGTDMQFGGSGRSRRRLDEHFDADAVAQRIEEDLERGRKVVDAPTGRVKVYLPAEAVGRLAWPIFLGTSGKNVFKGDSPLKEKLGRQVLHENLTIVDDPHDGDVPGSTEVDVDGVPTRRTVIFERGVLKTFLYDWNTAHMAGAEPTGHNGCSPYSTTIVPGEKSEAELLEAVGDGLYLKFLMGYGQGNIINGDFSANVGLGYRVRDGKIVGRVKNTMVAGNLYEILAREVLLGREVDPLYRCPAMVLDGVAVSGGKC